MVLPPIFGGSRLSPAASQPAKSKPPPKQNPLQDKAKDMVKQARDMLQKTTQQMAQQSGMLRVCVETAKIICSETMPPRKINQLKVDAPRSVVEGKRLAQIQDVKRGANIAPWKCNCKKRPKPGGGYLPCDYQPQGTWTPGVQTGTNDAKNPKKMSKAEKAGRSAGASQARAGVNNIASSPTTMSALQNAAKASGRSFTDLATKAIIESTGNAGVGTNPYGYTGLMQMGRAAAQDVGMPFSSLVGAGNVGNNALAGAKYMNLNAGRLPGSIPKDGFHLYMAHQQGAGGTAQLMRTLQSNPGAALTRNQANQLDLGRIVGRQPTQQDFYDYFKGKYESIEDAVKDKFGGPPKQMQLIPEIAIHKCTLGGTISIVDPAQNTKKAKLGGASMKPPGPQSDAGGLGNGETLLAMNRGQAAGMAAGLGAGVANALGGGGLPAALNLDSFWGTFPSAPGPEIVVPAPAPIRPP